MADVILVHGMWSHPGVLEPLRNYLKNRGHRVHVPLLPGHDPGHPWGSELLADLSIRDLADAVERFIEEKKFTSPPILVGHSLGGLVAQMVSARRPIGGLVLLNSAGPRGVNHVYPTAVLATINVLTQPFFWKRTNRPPFLVARFGLLNRVPLAVAREIHSSLLPESGRCFFETVFWFLDKAKTSEIDPEKIDAPLLIVSAGRDRIVCPAVASALKKIHPDAETLHFPRNGHWIAHEAGSHVVFRKIADWLEDKTSRADGGFIPKHEDQHHEPPRLSTLPSTPISPQQPAGFRRFLDRTRGLRRGVAENAAADRGTFLPRQAAARHRQRPHSHQRRDHPGGRRNHSSRRHG